MARCRICDTYFEDHKDLSEDDCCKKCVDQSEGVFDDEGDTSDLGIQISDDPEELGWY